MSLFTVISEAIEDDSESDDGNEESNEGDEAAARQVTPNPLYPEVTFKPRVKGVSYPKGPYLKAATPEARMLQMSMKFIPLANMEPKVDDPTYLFKVARRSLPFTKPHKKRITLAQPPKIVRCVRRPSPPPVTPPPDPYLGLRCPTAPGSLLKRAHENFVMTYVDYYNREVDPVTPEVIDPAQQDDPDKEWSISCAACCKLPKRPKAIYDPSAIGGSSGTKYAPPLDYVGPVAFFPDFQSLFELLFGAEIQMPEDATNGWMDSDGVFHAAVMGDALPRDSIIGYMDSFGVFHALTSVKDGVRKGLIDVRMANTSGIGPYLGDPRLAFLPQVIGFQVPDGTLHVIGSESQFGWVDDLDNFYELAPGESLPPNGIRAVRNNITRTMWLMSRTRASSIDDALIPPDSNVGYVDQHGDFFDLARGSPIPKGGTSAYETADQRVVLLSLAEGDDDWRNRLPQGSIGGYIDSNGLFHVLQQGDSVPLGGVPSYKSVDGKVIPIRMSQRLPLGKVPGYVDDKGDFHELKDGQALPPGATLASRSIDLSISPMGTSFGYIDHNGVFHELHGGQEIPEGGTPAQRTPDGAIIPTFEQAALLEGATYGYVDEFGAFHELAEGDELPRGSVLAMRTADGDLVSLGSKELQGAVLGYFDNNGVFRQLKDGESLPEGAVLIYRHEDGRVVLVEHERSLSPSSTATDKKGSSGYVDVNGEFHVMEDGEGIPEGATPAVLDEGGQVHLSQDGGATADAFRRTSEQHGGDLTHATEGAIEGEEGVSGETRDVTSMSKRMSEQHGGDLTHATKDVIEGETGVGGKASDVTSTSKRMSEQPGGALTQAKKGSLESATGGEAGVAGEASDVTSTVKRTSEQPGGALTQAKNGSVESATAFEAWVAAEAHDVTSAIKRTSGQHGGALTQPKKGSIKSTTEGEAGVAGETRDVTSTTKRTSGQPGGALTQAKKGSVESATKGEGGVAGEATDVTSAIKRISEHGGDLTHATKGAKKGDARVVGETRDVTSTMSAGHMAEYLKPGSVQGYKDKNGEFHALEIPPGKVPPGGTVGFIGSEGKFYTIPKNTEIGYMDSDKHFIVLKPGDTPPPDVEVGFHQSDGTFHAIHAQSTQGYRDKDGVYHQLHAGDEVPEGAVILQGVAGYLEKGTLQFHALHPGEEIPEGSMLIYRPIDEDKNATIPEGARTAYRAFDGTIRELKDGEAAPIGSIFGYVDDNSVFHPIRQEEDVGDDVDLRGGAEMTQEEKERFDAFKRSVEAQCQLQKVEGSLDLGEVFRKTFRIYSHGGSVDVDMKPEPPHPQNTN